MAVLAEPYATDRTVVISGVYTGHKIAAGQWAPAEKNYHCECGECDGQTFSTELYDEISTAAFYRIVDGFGRVRPGKVGLTW